MIKLIVFDFDGTLVGGKKVIYNIIKEELDKKGYRMPNSYWHELGNMPLPAHLRKIGIKKNSDLQELARKINERFIGAAKIIKPAKNIKSLAKIKRNKVILTNNVKKYVRACLKAHKINFFKEIHGGGKAPDKVQNFKLLLKKRKIKPSEVVYVGDKDHDAEVARKVGCISVVVPGKSSWSSREDIVKAKPDFVIDDLGKLKSIIDGL